MPIPDGQTLIHVFYIQPEQQKGYPGGKNAAVILERSQLATEHNPE